MHTPKVTIITVLNDTHPNVFENFLKNILKQTFSDFELIVINNDIVSHRNIDDTFELYKKEYWYYYNKETEDLYLSYLFGLWKAKGDYVAFVNPNDIQDEYRIEYQYQFLIEHDGEFDLIYNNIEYDDKTSLLENVDQTNVLDLIENFDTLMFHKSDTLINLFYLWFSDLYGNANSIIFNYYLSYKEIFPIYVDQTVLTYKSKHEELQLNEYNQFGLNKLKNHSIYYDINPYVFSNDLTCVILIDKTWEQYIERTIFNIRYTTNNVNIIIVNYDDCHLDEKFLKYYNVNVLKAKDYSSAYNTGISHAETNNLFIISNPILLYNQSWDLYLITELNANNVIIQPNISNIIKNINNNDLNIVRNINKYDKELFNIRYGERLVLLNKDLTNKLNKYTSSNNLSQIPILNDDLIFASRKDNLISINGGVGLDNHILFNVLISIKEYLSNGNIYIDKNFKCGVTKLENEIDNDKVSYFVNMYRIIYLFFNETKFMYENIIEDEVHKISELLNMDELVKLTENNLSNIKTESDYVNDMSYFLKNINNINE